MCVFQHVEDEDNTGMTAKPPNQNNVEHATSDRLLPGRGGATQVWRQMPRLFTLPSWFDVLRNAPLRKWRNIVGKGLHTSAFLCLVLYQSRNLAKDTALPSYDRLWAHDCYQAMRSRDSETSKKRKIPSLVKYKLFSGWFCLAKGSILIFVENVKYLQHGSVEECFDWRCFYDLCLYPPEPSTTKVLSWNS